LELVSFGFYFSHPIAIVIGKTYQLQPLPLNSCGTGVNFFRLISYFIALTFMLKARADDGSMYWFTFPLGAQDWRVMFPAPWTKTIYENAMTAVDILEVKCDGKIIVPELGPSTPPPVLATLELSEGTVVYQYTLGFFKCWINPTTERSMLSMRRFKIPQMVKLMEVAYRIRYPDGSLSKSLRVNFVATDQPIHILKLPPGHKATETSESTRQP
jgi:hypothetical protein